MLALSGDVTRCFRLHALKLFKLLSILIRLDEEFELWSSDWEADTYHNTDEP